MAKPYQILLPLLSLFLVRVDLTDLEPLALNAKVIKVLDGDTLVIQQGSFIQKLRLSKVDAPETHQKFLNSSGNAGKFSKDCLENQLKTGVHIIMIEGTDIYGRLLGEVRGLNLKLIEAGCMGLYPYAKFSSKKEKYKFVLALSLAKRQRKGIWKRGAFLQPKLWRRLNKRNGPRQWHRSNRY